MTTMRVSSRASKTRGLTWRSMRASMHRSYPNLADLHRLARRFTASVSPICMRLFADLVRHWYYASIALWEIATAQHGLVTARRAAGAGISKGAIQMFFH